MEQLRNLTKTLKALSDEGRLRIISLLSKKKDLCVCEIKELIGLSQSTISSHLKKLENSGLITYSKDGKWINYNINPNLDSDIKKLVKNINTMLKNDHRLEKDYTRLSTIKREDICKK